MIIPGGNLLNLALTVIQKQQLTYYAYTSRALTDIGTFVATYGDGVPVFGSFQPVPRNLFVQMGLDLQKSYATIYISKDVLDVDRDVSGDQFIYNGLTWQVESRTAWFPLDGWDAVLCVQVPNTNTNYITQSGFAYGNEAGDQFYVSE